MCNRPDREVAARYAAFTLEYRGVTLRDVYDARAALEVPSVGKLALDRTEPIWTFSTTRSTGRKP